MRGKKRRRKSSAALGGPVTLGSLDDLRGASKGGMDPSGEKTGRCCMSVSFRANEVWTVAAPCCWAVISVGDGRSARGWSNETELGAGAANAALTHSRGMEAAPCYADDSRLCYAQQALAQPPLQQMSCGATPLPRLGCS